MLAHSVPIDVVAGLVRQRLIAAPQVVGLCLIAWTMHSDLPGKRLRREPGFIGLSKRDCIFFRKQVAFIPNPAHKSHISSSMVLDLF
jgi:hypothetical protein